MDLLQQVVLLLGHHESARLFLALFELHFEGLGVDADPAIRDYLLARRSGDAPGARAGQMGNSLDAGVERQEVVLEVQDLDIRLGQWTTNHVLAIEALLVRDVEILVNRRGRPVAGTRRL